MKIVMSRVRAFKLAWHVFWMATGSSRVGIIFEKETNTLTIVGSDLIPDKSPKDLGEK